MENKKRGRPLGRPKASENETPTNELILGVATKLFLNNGFQKVSIDDVAKEAGVTKATVYYYFESKARLFKEAMISLMNRIRARIIMLLKEQKPLYERLYDVTVAHLQATTALDLDGFMRESKAALTDEDIQSIKVAEENMYLSIEESFIDAMESGEIPMIHAKFAAHSYIALIKVGNYKQPDGNPIFENVEETARNILNAFWKGFI